MTTGEHDQILLQFALSQVPVVVWTTDRELRFTSSRGKALAGLGLEPGQAVGMTLYDFFETSDPEFPPIRQHRLALEGQSSAWLQHWEGRTFQSYASPLTSKRGRIVGVVGMAVDVSEDEQARRALRAMSLRVAEAEQSERKRLARELHDRVGQNLTALSINLHVAYKRLPAESEAGARTLLRDCVQLVEEISGTVRDVMAELRPPVLDDFGLVSALQWYGERLVRVTGGDFEMRGDELNPRLAPQAESNLLFVAREALTNISRHAQAARVVIEVQDQGQAVRVTVFDDGIGFDPQAPGRTGWGLTTMQERVAGLGGSLVVESSPGGPTRVIVEIPRQK